MKVKDGFISNSSSTSFVIATKRPLTEEMLLDKIREYFSEIKGTRAYYKILSRALEVFFDRRKRVLDHKEIVFVNGLEEDFKYAYRGESSVLNQDNWACLDSFIINTNIRIDDKDFFMRSDDSMY